jgi:hypothetical protein
MQPQHGIQSLPVSQCGGKVRRIKCMFTTQLTKKRKTWSDGVLKVFYAGGCFQCTLIDTEKLRESTLCSRPLEKIEVDKLKKNEDVELEFENYLVQVTAGVDSDAVGPPLKLPKFIPPRCIAQPALPPVPQAPVQPLSSSGGSGSTYKVTFDELDDIWDRERPPKPQTANAAQQSRHDPFVMQPRAQLEKENVQLPSEARSNAHYSSGQPLKASTGCAAATQNNNTHRYGAETSRFQVGADGATTGPRSSQPEVTVVETFRPPARPADITARTANPFPARAMVPPAHAGMQPKPLVALEAPTVRGSNTFSASSKPEFIVPARAASVLPQAALTVPVVSAGADSVSYSTIIGSSIWDE